MTTEPPISVDAVASEILAAAVEVHRRLGPGFLEGVYERALALEMRLRNIPFAHQPSLDVRYKSYVVGSMRPDFLVANEIIVELKSVERLDSLHLAQTLGYLKAANLSLGLIINFDVQVLLRGVRRVVRT